MSSVCKASRARLSVHLLPFVCLFSGSQCLMDEAAVEPPIEQPLDAGTRARASQVEMSSNVAKAGAGGSKRGGGGTSGTGRGGAGGAGGSGGRGGGGGMSGIVARGGSGGRAGSAGSPMAGSKPMAPVVAGAGGAGGLAGSAADPPLVSTAWSAPELLEERSADVSFVSVAKNVKGDLAVAWLQDDPQGYLWTRRYLDGQWRGSALSVANESRPSMLYWPLIALDTKGSGLLLQTTLDAQATDMTSVSAFRWNSDANELMASKPKLFAADVDFGLAHVLAMDSETGHGSVISAGLATPTSNTLLLYHTAFDGDAWAEPKAAGKFEVASGQPIQTNTNNVGGAIAVVVPDPNETASRFESVVVQEGTAKQLMPLRATVKAGRPNVFLDDDGNAVMSVFLGSEHYVSRYTHGSDAWGEFEQLSTTSTRWINLIQPRSGRPVAIWFGSNVLSASPTTTVYTGRVYARFLRDDNTWSAEEAITGEISADVNDKCLGGFVSEAGELTVFWSQIGGVPGAGAQQRSIHSRRHRAETGWSEPTLVFGYTGKVLLRGMTAHDDTTMLLWLQQNPSNNSNDLLWTHSLPDDSEQ